LEKEKGGCSCAQTHQNCQRKNTRKVKQHSNAELEFSLLFNKEEEEEEKQ